MAEAPRREARERAMTLLYEADLKAADPAVVLAGLPVPPDTYTARLVDGTARARSELDAILAELAEGWGLDRMPVVDRAILRLALYELIAEPEVPAEVVLAEAVALAGRFSTEASSRYVNGVLANAARRLRGRYDDGAVKRVP